MIQKCWCIPNTQLLTSTARVSLRKYFMPGCVGRGLDEGLRILPAAPAPAASGNPGLGPLGIEVEKQGFRTAWLITGQKFPWKNLKSGSSLLTFRDLGCHICQIVLWMAESGDLDFRSCSQIWIFSNTFFAGFWKIRTGLFQNIFFCGFLKNGTRTFFQNLQFPKFHVPAIQKTLILT